MNRILIIAAFLAMLFSCSSEMGGRIDQKANVPAPAPVTIKSVRSISGGAVIKVVIPDDPYLKGVVAELRLKLRFHVMLTAFLLKGVGIHPSTW